MLGGGGLDARKDSEGTSLWTSGPGAWGSKVHPLNPTVEALPVLMG